ncbi:response regulator [Paenibacillus sp. J2TS4]|uniref:response regulator n=1 Tax=Paenibacillus sp. J2TS4 TaxID=2807194 RepID=UPI001B21536B|nr:response regulator [Paenibacillus sp. J2TS4]GIP35232.1 hypothetical protein J2TS4_44420 [Paenibacillus sp. J2TS4]
MKNKRTILIVDDTSSNILLFDTILGEEYEVLYATNGEEGLDIALKFQPDLILLDVMMPGMDGYEVCRLLKKNPLTMAIPIIFISVLDHEEDEGNGLKAGAIDYIAKPFNTANVKAKIKNHLEFKDLLLRRNA